MTELDRLKVILEIPADDKMKDPLLSLLLEQAREYILSYCRVEMVDERMRSTLIAMAAEDYGRSGGEGLSYRSVSGASEGYLGEYSPRIMANLRRFRRIGGPVC